MASSPADNINTINFENLGYIGSGTNAFVRRAIYNGTPVAVKIFKKNDPKSKAEFRKEIEELKRLSHPNIIKLIAFGKWKDISDQFNCMVLELADVGSLHSVIHESESDYSLGHGISCLLLMNGGLLLKVCDFGTVCDLKTIMSGNKGSPCWMAPEQLRDENYDEKCDVYSYCVIMWEIFARLLPYFHVPKLNSNQIMFSVAQGKLRPKKIFNSPKIIELLFERGLSQDPKKRPPMSQILLIMQKINTLLNKTPLEPIVETKPKEVKNPNTFKLSTSIANLSESVSSVKSPFDTAVKIGPFSDKKSSILPDQQPIIRQQSKPDFISSDDESPTYPDINRRQLGRTSYNDCGTILNEASSNNNNYKNHRRSKSHGNDLTVINWNINQDIMNEWYSIIESTIYNPIEPLYNENNSIFIFNLHKQLIKEDDTLQKEITKLKQQRDQLDSTIKNINTYNDLAKQKNLLIEENNRLRQVLNSKP